MCEVTEQGAHYDRGAVDRLRGARHSLWNTSPTSSFLRARSSWGPFLGTAPPELRVLKGSGADAAGLGPLRVPGLPAELRRPERWAPRDGCGRHLVAPRPHRTER